MDRHRRLSRTLASLVASMTLGAIVLDWLQPNQAGDQPHWQAIQIDPMLAGRSAPDETCHFIVDRNGESVPTPNWHEQRALGEPGVVRIGLKTTDASCEPTDPQWQETVAVVRDLQRKYGISRQKTIPSQMLTAIRSAPETIAK